MLLSYRCDTNIEWAGVPWTSHRQHGRSDAARARRRRRLTAPGQNSCEVWRRVREPGVPAPVPGPDGSGRWAGWCSAAELLPWYRSDGAVLLRWSVHSGLDPRVRSLWLLLVVVVISPPCQNTASVSFLSRLKTSFFLRKLLIGFKLVHTFYSRIGYIIIIPFYNNDNTFLYDSLCIAIPSYMFLYIKYIFLCFYLLKYIFLSLVMFLYIQYLLFYNVFSYLLCFDLLMFLMHFIPYFSIFFYLILLIYKITYIDLVSPYI